jgi:hypothetical protein
MSYSYINNVFPNFEYSNVYNEKLYANLNTDTKELSSKSIPSNINPFESNNTNFYSTNKEIQSKERAINIENFANNNIEASKNNLHYYNEPIIDSFIPNYANVDYQSDNTGNNKISGIEKFDNSGNEIAHENYIKHMSDCQSCKNIILKQFNIESDRIRNQEIIELISYIMFGLFILILTGRDKFTSVLK